MSTSIRLDGDPTLTSRDQQKTENDVVGCFKAFLMNSDNTKSNQIRLERDHHSEWLQRGLRNLPTNFAGLDASRPWFVFWSSHALDVLGAYEEQQWASSVASFLAHCQHPAGGFGGGPGQLAHLAPTYAAVSAIIIAGSEAAYKIVDREKTYQFLMRMKSPEGGFMMQDEGEIDMRGTYCAIAIASMLHILTDELVAGVPEYVRRCQTWEGGLAGEEGLEAHGGYSYCGLAALCILGKAHALDLHLFLNWAAHRQMGLEGGFQGRTNKLVDSCYSFWQGAIFPLLHEVFRQEGKKVVLPEKHFWFNPQPLQYYVFLACQSNGGGLRDKPGKSSDFYHSCYSLSGVAASQYGADGTPIVVGDKINLLERIDMFYNVRLEKSQRKCKFFEAAPPIEYEGRQILNKEGDGVIAARNHFLCQSE